MATRSLTEVFILMRNNALQNRHIFSEQVSKLARSLTSEHLLTESVEGLADDKMALVSSRDSDAEAGMLSRNNRLPPEWVDGVEEIQFEVSRIKQKTKDLSQLHDKHLNRPTLDDSVDEEHAIEICTQEITQMLMRCQRLVQQINAKSRYAGTQEQKLTKNITSSLARTLQELTTNFRKSQSSYLRRIKTREESSQHYFENDLVGRENNYTPDHEAEALFDRGFTDVQLQAVEENTVFVEQREREISQIVRSISDLNEVFKDLATMIVDQGTILDRIDYNIETTASHVESGLKQLQKAEKYQKKNRKIMVIVILFVIVILMVIIFIATKS